MTVSDKQNRWTAKLAEQLAALDGVETAAGAGGDIALSLARDGRTEDVVLSVSGAGYPDLKDQYARLRDSLIALGVEEGAVYVPPPPPASGRPATPQMRAARQQQKKEFEAWQEVWRTLRRAEQALEVDYEIVQMKDYY